MSYSFSQQPGISFDITNDSKFVLKLSQQGLYAHKIGDVMCQEYKYYTPLRRPLHQHSKDSLRCSAKNQFYAYTDRSKVVIGRFYEAGFSDHPSFLEHMSNVNTIDWAYNEAQLVSGSQDDIAILWDAETMTDINTYKGYSAASKISLVAMSKRNYNLFATCHDRDIKIWDKRRTNHFQAYAGHCNRITNLDWSPHEDHYFMTCSLDKTVKLWSCKNPKVPVEEKRIGQQVWRTLYDPLESRNVFIAIVVPDDRQNGIYPLRCEFYKDSSFDRPLNSGADSLIIEARISSQVAGGKTMLIGLTKTGTLKKWMLEALPSSSRLNLSSMVSPTETLETNVFHEMPSLSSSPNSANLWGNDVNIQTMEKYGKLVEKVDSKFVMKSNKSSMRVKMDLVDRENPRFQFEDFPNLSHEKEEFQLKCLTDKFREIKAFGPSHDFVVDKFIGYVVNDFMEQYIVSEEDISQASRKTRTMTYEKNVPFPRTCGARFSSNNFLVVFKRPLNSDSGINEPVRQKTFRSYLEITPNAKITTLTRKRTMAPSTPLVSDYYYPLLLRNRQTRGYTDAHCRSDRFVSPVCISDISRILPACCKELAEEYCLDPDKSPAEICKTNMAIAKSKRRQDLVQLWRVLRITTDLKLVKHLSLKKPWDEYPYGRKLIDSYIKFYYLKKDVQTLAMIYGICALVESKLKAQRNDDLVAFEFLKPGNMLFLLSDNLSHSVSIDVFMEESESTTPLSLTEDGTYPLESGVNGDHIKLNYANVLYNWDLLNKRAEILKTVKRPRDIYIPRGRTNIHSRESVFEIAATSNNSQPVWECAICRLPVRNLGSVCLGCYHGGHSDHLKAWFTSVIGGEAVRECPAGCGCICTDYMGDWDG